MSDTQRLEELRDKWGQSWTIWRSKSTANLPPGETKAQPNGWVATRIEVSAGPDMTVMENTAERLDAALEDQRTHALQGKATPTIAASFPL